MVTVFLFALVAAGLVIASMPKQYEGVATLFVGENRPISTGATAVQLDEVLAQSYAELLDSPAVADAVIEALPFPTTRSELNEAVSFEVLNGTRLIEVSALETEPARARAVANTFAETFVATQRRAAEAAGEGRLESLREQIGDLATKLQVVEGSTDPADVARAETLTSELAAAQSSFSATQESVTLQGSNISVAAAADLPRDPARPRTKLNGAVAVVLAAILAALAGLLRNTFDKRIRDEAEIMEIVEAPVLARIPVQASKRDGNDMFHEALRFLRANLRFSSPHSGGTLLAITSALPAEGKSTIVTGVARSLAAGGERTISVDCDLRRPMLATNFEVEGREGVTNVLVESRDPVELLQTTGVPDADVLASGPVPPNPAALLTTPAFPAMLARLRQQAQYVLVDTPPVTAVADASAVTAAVDGVVLVIDVGQARRDMLIEATVQLRKSGADLVGVVLNRVRTGRESYRYYAPYVEASKFKFPDGTGDRPSPRASTRRKAEHEREPV